MIVLCIATLHIPDDREGDYDGNLVASNLNIYYMSRLIMIYASRTQNIIIYDVIFMCT